MRISAIKGEPGYLKHRERRGVIVRLDGKMIRSVIKADEEQGYVVIHPRDAKGSLIRDHENGCYVEEVLKGKVEITRI